MSQGIPPWQDVDEPCPMSDQTDGVVTLRERVRERLAEIITARCRPGGFHDPLAAADAILREFRLQPVAVGKVDAETGEVEAG